MQAIRKHPTLKELATKIAERTRKADAVRPRPPSQSRFRGGRLLDYTAADWQARLKLDYTDPLTTIRRSAR